jgi:hypothetical protein
MIKRTAALALLLLSMAWHAAGQVVPDCTPGNLSEYEHLGAQGCNIGQARFFNFHYHKASGGLPPGAISVTPGTTPTGGDPGLLLEAHWAAPSQENSFISYDVEIPPAAKPLAGATLQMELGQISGTGEANVVTQICPLEASSDACGASAPRLEVMLSARAGRNVSDHRGLRIPLRSFRVISKPTLTTGRNGSARMNGFMMVFHFQSSPVSNAGKPPAGSH